MRSLPAIGMASRIVKWPRVVRRFRRRGRGSCGEEEADAEEVEDEAEG